MKGSVFKRCPCPTEVDSRGRRKSCRKAHGSWTFVADLGPDPQTGRRRQVRRSGFASQYAAQRALSDHLVALGSGAPTHDDRLTVESYLREWLESKASSGTRPTTVRGYRQHVDTYLVPHLGGVRLGELSPVHVDRMLRAISDHLQDGGALSPATVRRVHATLRGALGSAMKRRLVRYNAAENVELPRAPRKKVQPWEAAELGLFLDHIADHRLGSLFEIMAMTGLRRGEACGLRWDDVDVDRGRLVVRQQIVQIGIGSPCPFCRRVHSTFAFGAPKTASGENRVVDLDGQTIRILLDHRASQDTERAQWGSAWDEHGLVFCHEDGSPLSPEGVTRLFRTLCATAGLRRVRLHDLRHGQASLLLAAGVPLAVVSKRLGHSSISLTSDTYSHLLEGVGREAAERSRNLVPRASRDHSVTSRGS